MKQMLWVNGRLAWPVVATMVFISVSLLSLDFAWRIVIVPIETLLLTGGLITTAVAIALLAAYLLRSRHRCR